MLLCCGRSWLQHACISCVSAKAHQCLPASPSGCSEMGISKCLGLTETLPEVQFLQFQQVNASHKLLSESYSQGNCRVKHVKHQLLAPTMPVGKLSSGKLSSDWILSRGQQEGFTHCQSFCAVLLGSPAQSDQPLSSWLQIHFGFCLQSSPPSRWCSRCSLVGKFAGAPLKWEKMQFNGQAWKREDFTLDNLSFKISQLPGTLDHIRSFC